MLGSHVQHLSLTMHSLPSDHHAAVRALQQRMPRTCAESHLPLMQLPMALCQAQSPGAPSNGIWAFKPDPMNVPVT